MYSLAVVLDAVLTEIADARCVHCGFPVDGGALCAICVAVSLPHGARCERCDGTVSAAMARCGRCLDGFLRGLDSFRGAAAYSGPYRSLVLRGKHSSKRSWIEATATLVRPVAERGMVSVDAIIPVPSHRRRWAERGFNAAEIVARLLAKARGGVSVLSLLERVRHEEPLSAGASRAARSRLVRGAFRARVGAHIPERICLVDDVLTTGATLSACALALRRAGAREVHGWALLRAADPFQGSPRGD